MLDKPSTISTSQLNTLLRLHLWPINLLVLKESYLVNPMGDLILKWASRLICFQRLSLPNVATQRCSWRNNWYTRGSSIPVLSY